MRKNTSRHGPVVTESLRVRDGFTREITRDHVRLFMYWYPLASSPVFYFSFQFKCIFLFRFFQNVCISKQHLEHKVLGCQRASQQEDLLKKPNLRSRQHSRLKLTPWKTLSSEHFHKKYGVQDGNFEKNPKILFCRRGLNFFHPQEVPIVRQHKT